MFIDVDYDKRRKGYKLYLAKPNKEIIMSLSEAYGTSYSVKLGNVNEISFNIPYFIDGLDDRVENESIELVKERMYLKVSYNNSDEWMIIDSIEDNGDGSEKYMTITAFTNVYETTNRHISELNLDVVNPDEYYTAVLNDVAWDIGEIDPLFKDIYRTVELSNTSVLDAIITGAETYGAVLDFDTENKLINLVDIDSKAEYRGLNINYSNFLQSINRKRTVDEMTTRLYVYGADDLTIENANPTGRRYLEDFSFFLYPFERDKNKNVIRSSHYMSDELAHAILDINELSEEYQPGIQELQSDIDNETVEYVNEWTQLSNLEFDRNSVAGLLDIAKATGDEALVQQRQKELQDAEEAVENKRVTVSHIEAMIEDLERQLGHLQSQISVTSFSKELYDELSMYIIEKEFRDDRYIEEEELYRDALKKFEEAKSPNIVIEASIDNIIDSLEEDYYSDKIVLGDIARVVDKEMRVDMKSLITELSFDLDDNTCNITITNGDIEKDGYDRILSVLYDTQSTTSMLENNKHKWDTVTDVKTEVDLMRDGEIDATRNRIKAGVSESVQIEDRGIILSNPDFPDEIVIMQAGVIALSTDGGENWSTSITPRGVMADTIIGKLVASNNLIVTNDSGSFRIDGEGLTVDMDSIKIMSGEGDTPENIVDSWNEMLITMDEFADDGKLNEYEKNQIARQWNSIAITHSSMVDAIQSAYGPETPENPYPAEYEIYMESYERLRRYLNEEIQSDGHTILDPLNRDKTTEIDSGKYNGLVEDYQVNKDRFQTIIPLDFSQTAIEQTRKEISLNYVKNGEVATQLNLSEEGVRIDGRLLEINSETEFNDDLVMNAGVIRSRDNAINIDLNEGVINLSRPLTVNAVPVATEKYVDDNLSDAVKHIDVEYGVSSDEGVPPTEWSTETPEWKDGQYIWSRTTTTYKNGNTEVTAPVNITGATGTSGGKGDDGRSIANIQEQYYLSTSPVDLENGSWQDEPPEWKADKYIWTRSVITYKNPDGVDRTEPISVSGQQGPKGEDGDDAPLIKLSGDTQIIKENRRGALTPSTEFDVTAYSVNTNITSWQYSVDGGDFVNDPPVGVTRSGFIITVNPSLVDFSTLTIRVSDGRIYDDFTIAKAVDGSDGEDAYTILLTNEAHTFSGDTRSAVNGSTTTGILAYKGSARVPTTIEAINGLPNGMTTSISNNGTTETRIVITVTRELVEDSGVIDIDIALGEEIVTKQFSYSLAYRGERGIDAVTAYLTNDTHFIPTDEDGESGDYRNAFTEIHVVQGGRDVTSEYDISVVSEEGVDGTLSGNRYTVDKIISDHGEVIIKAVKDDTAVEKTFTVAKSKQGIKGIDSTVYRLNTSSLVLVRNIDDVYEPREITIVGQSKTGNGDYAPHAGYFAIYERSGDAMTVDEFTERVNRRQVTNSEYILSQKDKPLTLRYKSTTLESEVVYTPKRNDISGLYINYYEDENLSNILDSQTIMVVEDGKPNYKLEMLSTNGTQAVNDGFDTTLYVRLYRGAEDITDEVRDEHFRWIRLSNDPERDVEWNESHMGMKEIHVNSEEGDIRATYRCVVVGL